MRIQEVMTTNPKCCTTYTGLQEVARLLVECDCGEIPVVESLTDMRPVGVVTDRDIVCRAIAQGKNPLLLFAKDCMTSPAVTVTLETTAEECCRIMEQRQVRRIPVIDAMGRCCGIVSQADISKRLPAHQTASLLKEVSQIKSNEPQVQAQVVH